MNTMNIYAKPVDKIIFAFPDNGFDYDHDDATAAGLEEGTEYAYPSFPIWLQVFLVSSYHLKLSFIGSSSPTWTIFMRWGKIPGEAMPL